jgi:glyceraldehyde-3-phosphate dehydrogenase (NAD(P))
VVRLARPASHEEVLAAFRTSSRIAFVEARDGLPAPNAIKEMTGDMGRPHGDLYEVALWSDTLKVEGEELFYNYMVDNQAIVIPETVDAIRALSGHERDAAASIARTDAALGITGALV